MPLPNLRYFCPGAAPPRPRTPATSSRAHARAREAGPTPSASTVGPGRGAVAPRPERQQLPLAGTRAREAGYTHSPAVAMVMGPDGARTGLFLCIAVASTARTHRSFGTRNADLASSRGERSVDDQGHEDDH